MKITPNHLSIQSLFDQFIFRIPKYQRAYAWTDSEITDFLDDINNCYMARKENLPRQHFLGGIVSIGELKRGEKIECELVDGQQRMATIVLFVSNLIALYEKLKVKVKTDETIAKICKTRIERLTKTYIYFDHEINRDFIRTNRLELSGRDRDFFVELTQNGLDYSLHSPRDSHVNLLTAHKKMHRYLNIMLTSLSNIDEKLDLLERYEMILQHDLSVLHMLAETREDAYRLFQVLNDRGKNLSTGDLLRAKSLEWLEGFQHQQSKIMPYWDDVLSDSPNNTKDFLNWYYASYVGNRPRQSDLLKDFFKEIFNEDINSPHPSVEMEEKANEFVGIIKDMQFNARICRQILEGEWPYEIQQPVTAWQRNRLEILILHLRHTNCVPLLLAARAKLGHKEFSQVILLIERFAFRYIIMCKAHATKLNNEYLKQAVEIRNLGSNYKISNLQKALLDLQSERANDEIFATALNNLTYNERNSGLSNKPIKYFLVTIENYYKWYENGANGIPSCSNDHINIVFEDTTIEHIYPRSANEPNEDPVLEPIKNQLGNLTLLGSDNGLKGNEPFQDKKNVYKDCVINRDRELANLTEWTKEEIQERQNNLIQLALSIFSM